MFLAVPDATHSAIVEKKSNIVPTDQTCRHRAALQAHETVPRRESKKDGHQLGQHRHTLWSFITLFISDLPSFQTR